MIEYHVGLKGFSTNVGGTCRDRFISCHTEPLLLWSNIQLTTKVGSYLKGGAIALKTDIQRLEGFLSLGVMGK